MPESREFDSDANLIPFRREAQKANLVDMQRQKAGPAAINYVVRTLVEAAYAPILHPSNYRKVDLFSYQMPVNKRMDTFVELYIDVIKHDLGNLGYTICSTHDANYIGCAYDSIVLGACDSGSTGSMLESVIADSTQGPALRVSSHS